MKLKLILFLMVFSMLFIACDEQKPKADTYTLSGQLSVSGDINVQGKTVYLKIFNASKLSDIAPFPDTLCDDSGYIYSTSIQFPSTRTGTINYEVSGIPEGTYKFCTYIEMGTDQVISSEDWYFQLNTISINADTTYDIDSWLYYNMLIN